MSARDPFASWFSALESFGEHLTFRLGHCRDPHCTPDWFFLPHQRYDGLGGLAHVLRERFGSELELPQARVPPLGRLARALRALQCLVRAPVMPLAFRDLDPAWRSPGPEQSAPQAVGWALLSAELTERMRGAARAHGVSFNAWLLWGLGQALASSLVPGPGQFAWVVPVNLRGLVSGRADTDNHASTLEVAFAREATAAHVDAALRRELGRQAHWGTWQLLQWLGCCSPALVQRIARREMAVPKHGSFSNLGALGSRSHGLEEWWLAFNPVIHRRPIGAACLTWRGRLSLTLQVHPALSKSPRQACAWLNAWVACLLERRTSDIARELEPTRPVGSAAEEHAGDVDRR